MTWCGHRWLLSWSGGAGFELGAQPDHRGGDGLGVLGDPAVVDLADRHRVEVVQLRAPARWVTTSPACSSTARCFITPNRVIAGSASHSRPSVWPSAANRASSSRRRPASASALNTASSASVVRRRRRRVDAPIICDYLVTCQRSLPADKILDRWSRDSGYDAPALTRRCTRSEHMAVRLGDTAPDFTAETTQGTINFHEWLGDSWGVLFSHPKDFTPVCTTELGYMAKIQPEFEKRNVKVIGLSVDPTDRHEAVGRRHRGDPGRQPNYPIIGDADFNVVEALRDAPGRDVGRPAAAHAGRQPDRPQRLSSSVRTRRSSSSSIYPMTTGPQLRRGAARHRLAAAHRQAPRRHAGQLEAGRGRHHRRLGVRRRGQGDLPRRLEGAEAVHPHRPPAEQ